MAAVTGVGLVAFFSQDHEACDAAWALAETAADGEDIEQTRALWPIFEARMRRHLAMEEEILFPAFERSTGMVGMGPTVVMRHEHMQMRGLLDQMRNALDEADLPELLDQGDTLLMLIQQHNMKEEGMLYPMAADGLTGEWELLKAQLDRYALQA